ncbi:RHS repeat-associated core domain-containing protein [Streptomyces shenzhenensis]|uniref:RHS repeat-associated core domain-containing protein n=1 Tax=Streptomyces shenzhenensis TaxID=943815 RepID=UPI001F39B721|nr:RHS repeat-associated core domain-containing protein [Streptomyces shenzhenensis]
MSASADSVVPYGIEIQDALLTDATGAQVSHYYDDENNVGHYFNGFFPKEGDIFTYKAEIYYNWEGSEDAATEDKGPQSVVVRPQIICGNALSPIWFGDPITVTAPSWVHSNMWGRGPLSPPFTEGAHVSFTYKYDPDLCLANTIVDSDAPSEFRASVIWRNSDGSWPTLIYADEDNHGYALAGVPANQTYGAFCGSNSAGAAHCQSFRGEGVNTATGAFGQAYSDATLSGSVPLDLVRSYSSNNRLGGTLAADDDSSPILGEGWSTPWEAELEKKSDGSIVFRAEDGSQYPYAKSGDSYIAPATAQSKLTATADGYQLVTPEGKILSFNQDGSLTKTTDKQGRAVIYNRDGTGKISDLTTPSGQKAEFSYTDSKLSLISLSDGRKIAFGYADGKLSDVTDPSGNKVSYRYDGAGNLNKVIDPRGNAALTNTYNSAGQVTEQIDEAGASTKFFYNGKETDVTAPDGGIWTDVYEQNVLVSQYDPFGNQTSYGYSYKLDPVQVTDALGNTVKRQIDGASGKLKKITTPLASRTWSYNTAGNIFLYTNGNGKRSSYSYDSKNQLSTAVNSLSKKTLFTYTSQGQVESITDPRGKLTKFEYDTAGDKVSEIFPDGSRQTWGYDAAGHVTTSTDPRGNVSGANPAEFTTSYGYDQTGRLVSTKDAKGNTTRNTYDEAGNLATATDAAGNTTTYTYDVANRLTDVKDPAGHTVHMTYDVMGNVASRTDATGAKTTYTYDKAGRLLTMTSARGNAAGADASKYTWKYGYDKVGNQTTVTDPLGNTTKTDYDAEYRPVTVTDPLGRVRKTEYDGEGNVTKTTDALGKTTVNTYDANSQLLTTLDRGGKTATYTYDDAGNLASETTPLGNKTTYGYDDNGRLTTTVEPRGNATGADPAQYTWTTAYDAAGNILSQSDPYGNKTVTNTYDGDGRLTQRADALGNKTAYEYDALGRLTKATSPGGSVTDLGYDTAGNLSSRKDPNGHITTYAYDDTGRLTKTTDPLSRATSYGYDADGNRTSITNARGQKATSTYDARNQLTQTTFSDGTATTAYTYDAAGQPKTVQDGTGTRTLAYDAEGRPLTITSPGATSPFTYAYNDNGTLKSRTYPDGRAITYSYDSDGHILGQTAGGKTTNYTWDAAGNLLTVKLPTTTAVTEARTYDRAGRLASVSQGTGARFVDRDADGRVTKDYFKDATTTGLADRYAYDAAGRVTRACTDTSATASCLPTTGGSTYSYDKVGNLTTTTTPTSTRTNTYDAADQLTKRVEGTTSLDYTYDADGNLTKDAAGTYTSDPLGHLKSAVVGANTYTFVNDADGNRTLTNLNGALSRTTRWDINNPLPQIATETNSQGGLIADWQYNPEGIAESQNRTTGTFYLRHDRQNSTAAVYDATGRETYSYTYSPWGVATGKTNVTDPTSSLFQYTGQYQDPVLPGRLYLRDRSYVPDTGRFTSTDPEPASNDSPNLSPYAYAGNDPVNQSDPSGRCPLCVSAGIGAAIGATVEGGIYGWQHRNGGFTWGGFATATGEGALTGAIAGAIMPGAGNAAASILGLSGGRALATSAIVNAGVGAGLSWAVNEAHCQPTTPWDLLIGAAGGAGTSLLGPAFNWLKGKFPGSSAPTRYGPGAAHADDPALRGGSSFSLDSIPEEPGFNYLYRGVSTASPAYDDAVQGVAKPRGGNASMEAHHDGNTDSIYTSWTTSKQTALSYARGAAEGRRDLPGVILQVKLPLGQPVYPSIMFSTDLWESNENLVEGLVRGAKVFHVPAG